MGLVTKKKDIGAEYDALMESLGVDIEFLKAGKSLDNEDEEDKKEEKDKKENKE